MQGHSSKNGLKARAKNCNVGIILKVTVGGKKFKRQLSLQHYNPTCF